MTSDSSYPKVNPRIVVCHKCGCLYDLHYIDNVEIRKNSIMKFECKNCGMVSTIYKNLRDFDSSPETVITPEKDSKEIQ